MSGEITPINDTTPKTVVKPYVQANAGANKHIGVDSNAEVGVQITRGNKTTEISGKVGTTYGGHIKFTANESVGDDGSVFAYLEGDYTKSLTDVRTINHTSTTPTGDTVEFSDKYHRDFYKAGAGAGMTYAPNNKWNISLGAEAGFKGNFAPNYKFQETVTDENNSTHTTNTQVNNRTWRMYVTPFARGEYNINDKVSVNASANLMEGQVGVRLTF